MSGGITGQEADWEQRVRSIGWTVQADGCWAWGGERLPNGRARVRMRLGGKPARAYPYRVLFEAEHGPIPAGLVARHTCDRPWCVNPAHIKPGTQAENIHDIRPEARPAVRAAAKMRGRILQLRAEGLTHQAIAERLGVHRVTVSKVLTDAPTGGRQAR